MLWESLSKLIAVFHTCKLTIGKENQPFDAATTTNEHVLERENLPLNVLEGGSMQPHYL